MKPSPNSAKPAPVPFPKGFRLLQLSVSLMVFVFPPLANGQGAFQNMSFELAAPGPPQDEYGRVDIGTAMPGWSGYCGAEPQTLVNYNNQFLDSAGVALLTKDYQYGPAGFARGNYYVLLQGGFPLYAHFPSERVPAAIAQTAQIPSTANSLFVRLRDPADLEVTFAGQTLCLVPWSETSDYLYWGADLRPFSGQTGELRFTAQFVYLDDIRFSPFVIPEPESLEVIVAGLFLSCFARSWCIWPRRNTP